MFSCEYWEISKRTYFEEHRYTTAFEVTLESACLGLSFWAVTFKTILTLSYYKNISHFQSRALETIRRI